MAIGPNARRVLIAALAVCLGVLVVGGIWLGVLVTDKPSPELRWTAPIPRGEAVRLQGVLRASPDWEITSSHEIFQTRPLDDEGYRYSLRDSELMISVDRVSGGFTLVLVAIDWWCRGRVHVATTLGPPMRREYQHLRKECPGLPAWDTLISTWDGAWGAYPKPWFGLGYLAVILIVFVGLLYAVVKHASAPVLLLAILLASCGDEPAPTPAVPAWAKVAPEQIAEAKKHGVPVAFENDLGMRFVLIPAGTFLMGDPEFERRTDVPPHPHDLTLDQHRVTITHPYYMQITEVSNEQYLNLRPKHTVAGDVPAGRDGLRKPVVWVSFEQAQAFATDLSGRDGRAYRLPTEAEWERACRAGTDAKYGYGDSITAAQANLDFTAEVTRWRDMEDGRIEVGSLTPTPWGLHDMHGNVSELCVDWMAAYPTSAVVDPCVTEPTPSRVARGGAWSTAAAQDAAYDRGIAGWEFDPRDWHMLIGFRLVADLPDPGEGAR